MFLLNEVAALDDYVAPTEVWDEIPTKEYVRVQEFRRLLAETPMAKREELERAAWQETWEEDTITDAKPLPVDDDPWSRYLQEEDDIGGRG